MFGNHICRFAAGAAMALLPSFTVQTSPPQIWLAPTQYQYLPGRLGTPDLPQMFEPGAQWAHAAARTHVFKFYTQFIVQTPSPELARVFQNLKDRHIDLALEALIQTVSPGCGQDVEGYEGGRVFAARIAQKIKQSGGELKYLAMDEPLWFGHEYQGHNACESGITAIAHDVAGNIAEYRAVFPGLRVGDIEPTGALANQLDDIRQWLDAYRAAVQRPLDFFDADMAWDSPWQPPMRQLRALLGSRGIPLGVIVNGSGSSDADWIASARARVDAYEAAQGAPDRVIFQSWEAQPEHVLPENDPATMTALLDSYFLPQPRIAVRDRGGRLSGRVTDAAGQPLGRLPLMLEALPARGAVAPHQVSGTVPDAAAWVVLGLRINSESPQRGAGQLALGRLSYREPGTGLDKTADLYPLARAQARVAPAVNVAAVAPWLTRLTFTADEALLLNAQAFIPTPNAAFVLEAPLRVYRPAGDCALVAAIFLGQDGKELARVTLPLDAVFYPVAKAETADDGRFAMNLQRSGQLSNRMRASALRLAVPASDRSRSAVAAVR